MVSGSSDDKYLSQDLTPGDMTESGDRHVRAAVHRGNITKGRIGDTVHRGQADDRRGYFVPEAHGCKSYNGLKINQTSASCLRGINPDPRRTSTDTRIREISQVSATSFSFRAGSRFLRGS